MKHVPWITFAAIVVFFVTPQGQDLVRVSFFSGEQLARTLSQFLLEIICSIVVALGTAEWGIKFYMRRRRAKGAMSG